MQEDSVRQPVKCEKSINRILTFVIVPITLFLLTCFIGGYAIGIWLSALGMYTIFIAFVGMTNQAPQAESGRLIKRTARVLGMVVWGGFLALAYTFLYFFIFYR